MVDKVCDNCYYEYFDARAYPCSLCIRGIKRTDKWQAKIFVTGLSKENDKPVPNYTTVFASKDESQTEEDVLREQCRAFIDIVNYTERSNNE